MVNQKGSLHEPERNRLRCGNKIYKVVLLSRSVISVRILLKQIYARCTNELIKHEVTAGTIVLHAVYIR